MAKKKQNISEKNTKMYFKGALIGGGCGLALGLLIRRKVLFVTIIGMVLGGYVGYRMSDIKATTKTKIKFKNIKTKKNANVPAGNDQ